MSEEPTKYEAMRQFSGGATRDRSEGKIRYSRFMSPRVLTEYCLYLETHRETANGRRDQDNWKAGIPIPVYLESLGTHYHELWTLTEGGKIDLPDTTMEAINACLFNLMGLSYELIKQRNTVRNNGTANKECCCRDERQGGGAKVGGKLSSLLQSYQHLGVKISSPASEENPQSYGAGSERGNNGRLHHGGRIFNPGDHQAAPQSVDDIVGHSVTEY